MLETKSFASLKNKSLLFWMRVHFKGELSSLIFGGGCQKGGGGGGGGGAGGVWQI